MSVYYFPLWIISQWKNQHLVEKYSVIFVQMRDRRHRDRMVVGFATTFAISSYHRWCCVFESRSGRCVQHYVIKFVSHLRQIGGFTHHQSINRTDADRCFRQLYIDSKLTIVSLSCLKMALCIIYYLMDCWGHRLSLISLTLYIWKIVCLED